MCDRMTDDMRLPAFPHLIAQIKIPFFAWLLRNPCILDMDLDDCQKYP